jgi:hypothetical protein
MFVTIGGMWIAVGASKQKKETSEKAMREI